MKDGDGTPLRFLHDARGGGPHLRLWNLGFKLSHTAVGFRSPISFSLMSYLVAMDLDEFMPPTTSIFWRKPERWRPDGAGVYALFMREAEWLLRGRDLACTGPELKSWSSQELKGALGTNRSNQPSPTSRFTCFPFQVQVLCSL